MKNEETETSALIKWHCEKRMKRAILGSIVFSIYSSQFRIGGVIAHMHSDAIAILQTIFRQKSFTEPFGELT